MTSVMVKPKGLLQQQGVTGL